MKRLRRTPTSWLLFPLLLLFFWLALNSLVDDSPTMDEQNHLARGLAFLETGDPHLSLEHPPLINSLSALPVHALLDVRLPLDHPSWERPEGWYEFAELLLWEYNHDVTRMIFLARLPIVFLTMALALLGYRFARTLWRAPGADTRGYLAGLLAFFFLLFDPNILAHGRYTTTDLGGALFVLLAAALLWRLWRSPGWHIGRLLLAALGLGLAFGSKLSTLVFVPIFGLLALLPLYGERWSWRGAGRRLLQLLLAGAGSILVLWLVFGLEWGPFAFRGDLLAPLNDSKGPMPTFWAGIEQILLLSGGGRPTFLLGETSTEGFLAYFPVAFLVKTPPVTLALLFLAVALFLIQLLAWSRHRRTANPTSSSSTAFVEAQAAGYPFGSALYTLLPALLYFLISMSSSLNIGYRHLLPILPFIYLFIAGNSSHFLVALRADRDGLEARPLPAGPRPGTARGSAFFVLALSLLLALFLLGTLWIHPHYLSYFNFIAGGPANGYNVLIDSNIDWGQDLLRLQRWMASNGVDEVKLSWFGSADPAYYDIPYEPLPGLPRHFNLWWEPTAQWPTPFDPADPPPGTYAISASTLWELPRTDDKVIFPWFRLRQPDDRIGYSISVYRVEES